MTFGQRIRGRRTERGMTQTDLAEVMVKRGHRWSHSKVSRLETGEKSHITAAELADLVEVLDCRGEISALLDLAREAVVDAAGEAA